LRLETVKLKDASMHAACQSDASSMAMDAMSMRGSAMDVDGIGEVKQDPLLLEVERPICHRLIRPSSFSYVLRKHFLSPHTKVIVGRRSYFQLLQLMDERIASRDPDDYDWGC